MDCKPAESMGSRLWRQRKRQWSWIISIRFALFGPTVLTICSVWSFGGTASQAIAAQLERQGEAVTLLALLDPHPCNPHHVPESEAVDQQEGERLLQTYVTSRYGEKFTSAIGESLLKILCDILKNNSRFLVESSSPVYQGDACYFERQSRWNHRARSSPPKHGNPTCSERSKFMIFTAGMPIWVDRNPWPRSALFLRAN